MSFFKNTFVALASFASLSAFAQDGPPPVEKCAQNLGSMAVVEPQSSSLTSLNQYGLRSPLPLLRIYIQQSGCFTVVERGVAMQNLQQERALASQGQLRGGSNVGGAQMVAADFVMTPNVIFAADTGGGGGSLGGLGRLGGLGSLVGAIAGGLKFKEANTSLIVADVRSGVQVAAAEGNAKKMDFAFGALGWGWAGAGGYTSTPEGKLVASSLLDNYNNIVKEIRDKSSLINQTGGPGTQANAQAYANPAVVLNAGDTYKARLNNVKVFAKADDNSDVLATLKKDEEIIISGKESGDYLNADGSNFSNGWVLKRLVVGGAGGAGAVLTSTGGSVAVPSPGLSAGCAVLKEISPMGPFCNSGIKITILRTKALDTGTAKSVDCKLVLKIENNSGKFYNNINFFLKPVRTSPGSGISGEVSIDAVAMGPGQSTEVETRNSYTDRTGKCNNIDYMFDSAHIY